MNLESRSLGLRDSGWCVRERSSVQPGPVVGEMGAQRRHLHFFSPDLSSLLPTLKCLCPPVPSGLPRPETIPTSSKCFHSLTNASPGGLRLCGQVAVGVRSLLVDPCIGPARRTSFSPQFLCPALHCPTNLEPRSDSSLLSRGHNTLLEFLQPLP